MSRYKKYARCPRCMPDQKAACFTAEMSDKGPTGEFVYHWVCNNCGHDLGPVRRVKATGRLTNSQREVIKMLRRAFGGLAKWQMIGRNAFVTLDNPRRKWFDGTIACGTVGPKGAFEIKFGRLGMGTKVIKDKIGVDVYLEAKVK